MKRIYLGVLLIMIMVGTVFGGNQEQDTQSEHQVSQISIGVYNDLESAFNQIINLPDFKTRFPDLVIDLQPADFGGHHNRVLTQLAAGIGANDIEALDAGYLAKFYADGGLTDLSKAPYNGPREGAGLLTPSMSFATSKNGELIAFPISIDPTVMYYRKSIVDENGVNLTTCSSWEDFITKAKQLVKDRNGDGVTDQYAIANVEEVALIPLAGGFGDWVENNGNPFEPRNQFMGCLELDYWNGNPLSEFQKFFHG